MRAQFSRPEFDGMAQWSPGMTMVGDMLNERLKIKLDAVATALAAFLRRPRMIAPRMTVTRPSTAWPAEFEVPGTSGAQNNIRYAFFPISRRLVVEDSGARAVYNTGDHHIQDVFQS